MADILTQDILFFFDEFLFGKEQHQCTEQYFCCKQHECFERFDTDNHLRL